MQVSRVTAIYDRVILDMIISGIIHSARKQKRKSIAGVGTTYNVVVFGASETGCKAFVSNMLREAVPEGILCLGADSPSSIAQENISTGLVLILPEVCLLNEGSFEYITSQIQWLAGGEISGRGKEAASRTRIITDVNATDRLYEVMRKTFEEDYIGRVFVCEQEDASMAHAITTDHIRAVLHTPTKKGMRFGKVKNSSIVFDDNFAQLGGLEIACVIESALAQNPGVPITITSLAMSKLFEHCVWNVLVHDYAPSISEDSVDETYNIGD
jgi:hypothetical protein